MQKNKKAFYRGHPYVFALFSVSLFLSLRLNKSKKTYGIGGPCAVEYSIVYELRSTDQ